ncbi:MAG: YcaO-like family protein [Nitrososphaeraceae archaeon]
MRLKETKKYTTQEGRTAARSKSSEETLNEIMPTSDRMGVTRLSDITCMDRLYIPNFSAMLPGTVDSIWVYSGKGLTKTDAKVSALMEAIERYSSLGNTYAGTIIRGSYSQLSKTYEKVLRPDELIEPINEEVGENTIMDYLLGYDLISAQNVLVPAEIALYKYTPPQPAIRAFPYSHTNGLAAGNTMEEAISHALCEVIERDALSIAELCSSSIAYTILDRINIEIGKIVNFRKGPLPIGDKFVDDPSLFPEVDINESDSEPIKVVVRKFARTGLPVLVKNVTQQDIGVTTFVASCIEWITHDYGYFARGYGTHPDSETALLRALTEVSQTRAANVQGARDDLKRILYNEHDEIYKRKWQFMHPPPSHNMSEKSIVGFNKIKSYMNLDILDDINLVLSKLKKGNLDSSIVVDLTKPSIGIPVVRVIVPGLETFHVTESIMGSRAQKYFKRIHS